MQLQHSGSHDYEYGQGDRSEEFHAIQAVDGILQVSVSVRSVGAF